MTDTTPAALVVWEAFNQFDHAGMHVDYGIKLAVALRAAALYTKRDKLILLSIAAELEGKDAQ